jgi:hypothetical protein
MDENKIKLNSVGATGILPSLNLTDNTAQFGGISPLVAFLRQSHQVAGGIVVPGAGDTTETCGVIKSGSLNSIDMTRDGCSNVAGDLGICTKEFKIGRLAVKNCDLCADLNDVIRRKNGDVTAGGLLQAGDSVTEANFKIMKRLYDWTLNQSTVLGDPTNTTSTVMPVESLSSAYTSANGVNVISGAGLPIWKAIEIAMQQKAERGFASTGRTVFVMNTAAYLRAQEESRTFTTNLLTSFNPYAGIEILVDNNIPNVAGQTMIYELELGNSALFLAFTQPKEDTIVKDDCGERCTVWSNYAGVYLNNPCALSLISNVQVQQPRFAYPMTPSVYC